MTSTDCYIIIGFGIFCILASSVVAFFVGHYVGQQEERSKYDESRKHKVKRSMI